jgi:hypothetical protein
MKIWLAVNLRQIHCFRSELHMVNWRLLQTEHVWVWDIQGHECILSIYCLNIHWGISPYQYKLSLTVSEYNKEDRQDFKNHKVWLKMKTGLLAAAHHCLHCGHKSDILFKNCFFYETSIKNQQIESWWNQLNKMLIYCWCVGYLLNSNSSSY